MAKVSLPHLTGNGCELWDDCFTCIFPDCIGEGVIRKIKSNKQMLEVQRLTSEGKKTKEIAVLLNVSTRLVRRYKQRGIE